MIARMSGAVCLASVVDESVVGREQVGTPVFAHRRRRKLRLAHERCDARCPIE